MTFHGSPPGGRRRPLSPEEALISSRRISNIVGDEARITLNDKAFNDYSSRQVSRNTNITGGPVDNRFDRFTPSVDRLDLGLEGSVGDNGQNFMRDVFGVKKALFNAGGYEFAPGVEPVLAPNDRFKKAIRDFQAGNELKVDGRILPGGPSIHMLGLKALGQEDGKPPGYDAAAFKQNTGRDPNRTLSGKPIFATPGKGGGAGPSGTQQAMHRLGRGFGRGRPGRGSGRQEKPWLQRKIEEQIDKKHDSPRRRFKTKKPEANEPVIGKTPASIIRYPDGRVYILVDPRGKIQLDQKKPGIVNIAEIDRKSRLVPIRKWNSKNYPKWEDRQSFQEREAAGLEGYVYGPVRDKNGKVSYTPLIDPSAGGIFSGSNFLRIPVKGGIFLTLAQIKAMGLSKWHVADR